MKMPEDKCTTALTGEDLEGSKDGCYFYQKLDGENFNWKEEEKGGNPPTAATGEAVPCFVMPLLAAAVGLGSIAGPIMKMMENEGAEPLQVATWRHEISALVMFPFAVYQWFGMKSEARQAAFTWCNFGAVSLCALGLASHFGFWIWSLQNTALTHSLFLCILSPVFVTFFTLIRGGTVQRTELLAVGLGLVGSSILAAGAEVEKDAEFTLLGDLAALAAACGFALYLLCGKNLRGKLPLFVYLWPVNVMVFIYLGAILMLSSELGGVPGGYQLISWTTEGYATRTLILGVGPGVFCHFGYNISMGYVKPLVVSVAMSVVPLLGSIIGWWMGETGSPGLLTVFGGMVTMAATIWLSHASSKQDFCTESEDEEQLLLILVASMTVRSNLNQVIRSPILVDKQQKLPANPTDLRPHWGED
ncbi:hypothetical protein R1sor_006811 [Riccia sorocarpa]|uniref:EamA domain-containing protein n=1 Tax=Riccia sorocarpa TaxID=122646 RepID=A0ABD3HSB2_9MARC